MYVFNFINVYGFFSVLFGNVKNSHILGLTMGFLNLFIDIFYLKNLQFLSIIEWHLKLNV